MSFGNDSKFYEGKNCKHCGNPIRYVANASCVECTRKRSLKSAEERRQKRLARLQEAFAVPLKGST